MKLIVGLGNPGNKYKDTKHNVGFMSLDSYAEYKKLKYKKSIRFTAEIAKENNCVLLKPKTYMNNSGLSVVKAMKYYKIEPQDVMIIFDDLNLPFAKIRLRGLGSAGGHNGIKSIISHISTDQFKRLRVGIGRSASKEMKDDVLSSFNKTELKVLNDLLITTNNIIDDFVDEIPFDKIMNKYN